MPLAATPPDTGAATAAVPERTPPGKPRGSVASSMVVTFTSNVAVLALNLFTGILTARALAPEGRGEVAAVTGWALTVQLIASLGFIEGMVYVQSRRPDDGARIFGTGLALTAVLGGVGLLAAELLLPLGLAAQSNELIRMARVAILMMLPVMAFYACNALYNAHHRFLAAAVARVGQPLLMAIGLGALWMLDRMTVGTVLALNAVTYAVAAIVSIGVLGRWYGIARPSVELARRSMAFGIRAYGESLGNLVNARLDVMIMPALLAPEDIGLYVVAVSAAGIVMPLFAQLRSVVFSVAARGERAAGIELVERTLRLSTLGAAVSAVFLAAGAPWLVRLVWGPEFSGAVTSMRILLPGLVCWVGAAILTSGLKAINRPLGTSAAQFGGMIVTAVGLAITLPTIGIVGAAITSSVSYTTVLVISLWLLAREPEFDVAEALAPSQFVADVRWAFRRSLAAARRGKSSVVRPSAP
jgi:O-antigen/teichoic acid export membrane protein